LALLTVPIQSANAVASERINERLGAILTTPLTAREILDEWLAPIGRWIQFLTRPLIVVFVVEAIVKFTTQDPKDSRWTNLALYMGISFLTVWIYPALVQWSCFWIGLRIRNQIRALMTALLLVVVWCIIPLVASSYLAETGLMPTQWSEPLRFVSPVTVIGAAEALGKTADNPVTSDMVVLAFVQLGLAAALTWWVRRLCLTNADRYLGRV
jgi:chromate transport protein ChrA